jgi:hypothetical protein
VSLIVCLFTARVAFQKPQKPVPTVELVLFHSLGQASSGYSADASCARCCVFMNIQ